MKTVYKYDVNAEVYSVKLELPAGAKIVHVGNQGYQDVVNVWVELSHTDGVPEIRTFRVFGTGHEIPSDYEYVGTTIVTPYLAWHLYELVG